MDTAIPLDVISDTVCPWCYIGKRRLESALVLRPDIRVDIRWRPFQLDPTVPKGGVDRRGYLEQKFGGPEGARAVYARIEAAGAEDRIPFAFERIAVTPNTLDSHRLIRWAAAAGVQDQVVERLFARYFTEGGDIGDAEELAAIAGAAGMDTELVGRLLADDADLDRVEEEIALAQRIGVSGVPCFVFADRFAVMGAQPAEAIAEALDQATAEERQAGTGG